MMEAIRMEMKTEVMRMKMKTEDSPSKLATSRPVERRGGAGGCGRLPPRGEFPEYKHIYFTHIFICHVFILNVYICVSLGRKSLLY